MGELRINISKLSEGTHDYSLETQPGPIGLDERFSSTVRVNASIEKGTRQLYMQVQLDTTGDFVCDRCLEGFRRELTGNYAILYVTDHKDGYKRDFSEEVQLLSRDTNYIDLDEDVRQYLLLAVPQKLLCREDCKGLCPTCGTNRNNAVCQCSTEIDPRWDDLKKVLRN